MSAIVDAWTRFWFRPEPTSTLGLVRVAFGGVVLAWTISLAPDLATFFSPHGTLPAQPDDTWSPALLGQFRGGAAVVAVYAVLLTASLCLLVGYRTRLAAVVVFVGVLSFERRNPFVFNSGDLLVLNAAFFLALAPAGEALSVDRLRRARERFWEFPLRAPWAMRLIQIQLSALYVATVWAKLRGVTWNNGTAVSIAQRIADLQRFAVPAALSDSVLLSNVLTYGTLGLEVALAFLVWNRRARPWVLLLGVAMHVLIALTILVGFFTMMILVSYLAFVPPETAARWARATRARLDRSRGRPEDREIGAPAEAGAQL